MATFNTDGGRGGPVDAGGPESAAADLNRSADSCSLASPIILPI
jgi:hypothetical protein